MTTIILADDHSVVRQGLRALLESEFRVVAETGDGLKIVPLVEKFKPDLLVLDVMMPGLTGTDAARQIRRISPNTRIIMLSMYSDEAYVIEALKSGAVGYVLKGSDSDELMNAVREVAAGRRYLSPQLSERVIQSYIQRFESSVTDAYDTLTPREREILHLAAEGLANVQIAARLSISKRTVETHRANVMHKLKLRSQAELVRYAMSKGIIEMPKRSDHRAKS